jgi:hypothetical protein
MLTTRVPLLFLVSLILSSVPALGWTPKSQLALAQEAVSIAPVDLRRQLERHGEEYERGVLAPFRDDDPQAHQANSDGSGHLGTVLAREVERAIEMIRAHRGFREVAYQAGVVVHYANDLNNPLNCAAADGEEGRYFGDFLGYLESASPRIPRLFYGLEDTLERGDVTAFVAGRLANCRELYPFVGREYRRIGWTSGARYFDDRSTAFGVASLAHSGAITDAALLLRYIWLASGGADWRQPPRREEGRLLVLPRGDATTAGGR